MSGDDGALQAQAERHLPLVGAMLRRFPHAPEDREELYQQGCIGLRKALNGFDAARVTAFSTYAAAFFLGEMRQFRRDKAVIHVPRSEETLHRHIRQAQNRLSAQLQRDPTIQEVAKEMDMDASELMLHLERPQAISADALSEGGTPLSDILPDPEDIQKRIELRDILQRLPEMDQRIVTLRHRIGLTQAETGQRLGLTQMQVSRRESVIRTLLKRALAE